MNIDTDIINLIKKPDTISSGNILTISKDNDIVINTGICFPHNVK